MSVVCKIEMQIVSELNAAAVSARVGTALTNPARQTSFKKSRRVQYLSG